jgi:DNA adenine methylase
MTPPLKWHGGKHYLAAKIIALMPPHLHYVEPFFGGGAVLLAKPYEGISEVANDLNKELINFWNCLRHREAFEFFRQDAEAAPFSQELWQQCMKRREQPCGGAPSGACVRCAFDFFVACRQSMSGRIKDFAPLTKRRTRRGMNEQVSAWLTAVEGLPEVHARLKRVAILCNDALNVIDSEDSPDTLFYCDPPYLHATRAGHAQADYVHEMTDEQHRELWRVLARCQGKWMLSGYPSPLYEQMASTYSGVRRHEFTLPNNAAWGNQKRLMTECLWTNY